MRRRVLWFVSCSADAVGRSLSASCLHAIDTLLIQFNCFSSRSIMDSSLALTGTGPKIVPTLPRLHSGHRVHTSRWRSVGGRSPAEGDDGLTDHIDEGWEGSSSGAQRLSMQHQFLDHERRNPSR